MEQDLKINFLNPSGPARSFHWPRKRWCLMGCDNRCNLVQATVTATANRLSI